MARKTLDELLKKMDNDELEVLKEVTEERVERELYTRTWEVRKKYKIGECFINFDKALNCAWLYKVIDYQSIVMNPQISIEKKKKHAFCLT